jgi:hypothetical protein
MLRTRPGYRQTYPDDYGLIGQLRALCFNIVMFDISGEKRGNTFELCISVLVVLNTFLLAMYYFQSPKQEEYISYKDEESIANLQYNNWTLRLDTVSDGFSIVFFVEMLLKVCVCLYIYVFLFLKYLHFVSLKIYMYMKYFVVVI